MSLFLIARRKEENYRKMRMFDEMRRKTREDDGLEEESKEKKFESYGEEEVAVNRYGLMFEF